MNDANYNLLDEPFIPIEVDRVVREMSIREVLVRAEELGEVRADSPLEAPVLMRLLLAVLYAAVGPKDTKEAAALFRAGRFPREPLEAYIDQWHDRFGLFGERPFLQIGDLTMAQAVPLAALATELATGNNATLFDHTYDENCADYTPAQAARKLLATQAFALGFGKAAEATVGGRPLPRPYLADAICLRGVTVWLSGRTLFETLVLNLVPGEETDRPLWERDDTLERLDRVVDGKRLAVRAKGALDRYVWQSRMVCLLPETDAEGRIVVRRAYVTQGREADKSPGDPMKVFVESKTEGIYPLGLNAGKASWRDLHSLLAFNDKVPRPKVFRHAAALTEHRVVAPAAVYGLNVVGLATDPGKAGKFLLWRHDRLSVPPALLGDETLVDLLSTLLSDAEFVAGEMRERTYYLAKNFVPPHGNPAPKDVAHLADALDARPAYWARLENHFVTLLARLPRNEDDAVEKWRAEVEREAEQALRESCRQLGHTPQALRATAQVSFRFEADAAKVLQERRAWKEQAERKKKEGAKRERIAR